ncbi:hypothetical protein HZC21_01055 [Candidatus Peregrinibacteria bacterium]|nr:hypothetical protein [Candidatus Peregrinibacteria bacterium]
MAQESQKCERRPTKKKCIMLKYILPFLDIAAQAKIKRKNSEPKGAGVSYVIGNHTIICGWHVLTFTNSSFSYKIQQK